MEEKLKNAVEEYQCSGCMNGGDISCFVKNSNVGIGCGKHSAGTIIGGGIGKIFLGLPKGFCRLGVYESMKPFVHEKFTDSKLDKWNIPCWKYLNENGHTIVRGFMPRKNEPFIDIYLENCMDKIDCLEITQKDIDGMD